MNAALAELRIWGDAALILAPIVAIHATWWGLIVALAAWRGWDAGNVSGVWALGGMAVAGIGIVAGRMEIFGLGMAAVVMTAAWPLTILYHYAGLGAWRAVTGVGRFLLRSARRAAPRRR